MPRNRPRYGSKPIYLASNALRFARMTMKDAASLRRMASVMLDGKEKIMTIDRIKRYAVSGDIAYPVCEDLEGDYVTYEDHVAAIEADRKRIADTLDVLSRDANGMYEQEMDARLLGLSDGYDYAAQVVLGNTRDGEADRKRRGEPVSVPKQAEPSGYAYRYRYGADGTVLRFNSGEEVNGARPVEAVPFWFAPPNATTVTCQLYGYPLKTCAECNHEMACSTKPVKVPGMRELIADDAYAATFQSVGQYRKALLAHPADRQAAP